ncbi:MAG: DNA-directed RNA polymerase subunit alpha [Candidatus Yonathbacteria bacterium RIFOXYC1_FULL_52_10]|uniref:DNA-directed RNA polymerase subunit alpha n=1 Tax=Candidatus Yonathbacteria bacterium RIFOXYD1_FULL_52_36 TaxID=1802730 RepID=A0A1G2SK43_9BACT|nr:MAG: DNA-directed RNA polymerase subunit alpha [Candidatus Yonathbacteria bacterium RIFOXYC1_FULL_52_10]OHA85102.1 MAG: DNA-directed RNA polymerase subunit alpha [Candidatus Yonathbacteria bacterium RIFOXYD1_FULL_52_36]
MILPSKPRVVSEDSFKGVYEIDGLYPGYGHTLGNSLRRIILSSLPGAAITSVKIDGVSHEFSTMEGVKEDVIMILLNLKKVRFQVTTDEPVRATISVKGVKSITAGDIKLPGQVEVLNPELHIADVTGKGKEFSAEIVIQRGLGYVPKEVHQKEKVEVGMIALDAIFTPIRRVNYEVENMRVGERTDHNRLRVFIETDGTISPRESLEKSVMIMINQLKSIVGFTEDDASAEGNSTHEGLKDEKGDLDQEFLKTRIETLDLSTRTANALAAANIRTVGGLARKKEEDLLEIDGMGEKGIEEIKQLLREHGISLK